MSDTGSTDSGLTETGSADTKPADYGADSISVLEGLAAVRKRPDMYIGGTDTRGLHHLVSEVLDNSVDEALAGHCDRIRVTIHEDGSLTVVDNGRGIPTDMHKTGKSALEVVMTVLHAGGKFDNDSYKVSGGLHGVGVSVVNGLSVELEANIYRAGKHYRQLYSCGAPQTKLEVIGDTTERGTSIRFKPDKSIFETVDFQHEVLSKRCRELAFLNKGLRIIVEDERNDKLDEFYYEEGIKAFIRHHNSSKEPIHKDIVYFEKEDVETQTVVEVALQYNQEYSSDSIYTFANNINTEHGGTHLSGFKSGVTRTLNKYARDNKVVKDNDNLPDGSDYLEGLVAIVSVKLPDPKFESQTKVKLSNTEVEGIVQQVVNEALGNHLEETPQTAKAIINKASQARQAREAARKARDLIRRKSVLSSGNLPGKLADCSSRDPQSTEIYIVEGDSAGGSAKMGRVREYQAILPIRGKILNVEKTRIDKMLGHQEIQTIISALGTGIGHDDFDLTKLRYHKVIIMTDADVDGSHIRTLLLTFFFRQMPQLIEAGHMYIAQPPLFEMIPKKAKKKSFYIQDEREYEKQIVELGSEQLYVKNLLSGEQFTGEKFADLCRAIGRLEKAGQRLFRRGVDIQDYLQQEREEDQMLPSVYVAVKKPGGVIDSHYFFDSESSNDFVQSLPSSEEKPLQIATGEDGVEARESADVVVTDIFENKSLNDLVSKIRSLHFSPKAFRLTDREDSAGRPKYEALAEIRVGSENEEPSLAYDLLDLAACVTEAAERRFEVKRFKGLGEMNPDQLFATTMDPAKRTLLKVTINDAYKADEYFSILMGSEVEPRRKFIQENALDVKNLDV